MSRILLEVSEGIATVTLNYPETHNRLAGSMREDLLSCVLAASQNTAVGCIVIAGKGRDFCGGADVEEMLELHHRGDVHEVRRRVELGSKVVGAIRRAPQPVVAAVNGLCAGAGMGLALACDIRLGTDQTRFAAGFVRLGLLPDWGGLDSVVRATGHGGAADILLSGNPVGAERALSLGLLHHLYARDELDPRVRSYAQGIARSPRLAVLAIKQRLIHTSSVEHSESLLEFELEQQSTLFLSEECGRALQHFVDRQQREQDAQRNDSSP